MVGLTLNIKSRFTRDCILSSRGLSFGYNKCMQNLQEATTILLFLLACFGPSGLYGIIEMIKSFKPKSLAFWKKYYYYFLMLFILLIF